MKLISNILNNRVYIQIDGKLCRCVIKDRNMKVEYEHITLSSMNKSHDMTIIQHNESTSIYIGRNGLCGKLTMDSKGMLSTIVKKDIPTNKGDRVISDRSSITMIINNITTVKKMDLFSKLRRRFIQGFTCTEMVIT